MLHFFIIVSSVNRVSISKTESFDCVCVCVSITGWSGGVRLVGVWDCAIILSDWLSGLFGGVSGNEQEVQAEMTSSL